LKDVYIWLDEDEAGRSNGEKMARKIGLMRARIVRPAFSHPDGGFPKDANEALLDSPEMIQVYLDKAQ
jgi:DNA primase